MHRITSLLEKFGLPNICGCGTDFRLFVRCQIYGNFVVFWVLHICLLEFRCVANCVLELDSVLRHWLLIVFMQSLFMICTVCVNSLKSCMITFFKCDFAKLGFLSCLCQSDDFFFHSWKKIQTKDIWFFYE